MGHLDCSPPCGKRILLVEDERDVLGMLQEILSNEGHETREAPDGTAALDCFCSGDFDIVFTDMYMPGVSGIDVAVEIKKIRPLVPVVLMTGWDLEYEGDTLREKGVDLLIKKPFTITDILQAIALLCP